MTDVVSPPADWRLLVTAQSPHELAAITTAVEQAITAAATHAAIALADEADDLARICTTPADQVTDDDWHRYAASTLIPLEPGDGPAHHQIAEWLRQRAGTMAAGRRPPLTANTIHLVLEATRRTVDGHPTAADARLLTSLADTARAATRAATRH